MIGGAMQDSSSKRAVEARAAARTNLFMAATLVSGDASHAVKIRDLSEIGARIETLLPIEVGAAVTLVRGTRSVHARVGWHAQRFCGLSFASPISVQDWIASPVNAEREAVAPLAELEVLRRSQNSESPGEELTRVSRWLEAFGKTLSNDPQVVFKHGTQLFSLGLAARALGALAKTMQGESSQESLGE
jgi:hypothetical protein